MSYSGEWTKWLPSDPIPAHWYDAESLQRLIFLTIAKSRRDGNRDLPLGEFIRQFRGLSSTAKAREIAGLFPTIRHLPDFEAQEATIPALLKALQQRSRPVPAKTLGLIGEAPFRERFEQWYGVHHFWYKQYVGEDRGLPLIIEAALAQTKSEGQHRFFGLNFSPTFGDPFQGSFLQLSDHLKSYSGVVGALDQAYLSDFPHAFALHVARPTFMYRDRGKSTIALGD